MSLYDLSGSAVLTGDGTAALSGQRPGAVALVLVPTSERPRYALSVAELTGGRRLLSDDLAALDAIAVMVARRIDAIRMTNERHEREVREQESAKLASEAELRALRAQLNPHFLFNALTTIGYLIQTAPPRALQTLMRLTTLLRAVLRSEGEFTTLGHELEIVESYLEIERARFDERLRVRIDVPRRLRSLRVPPLVLSHSSKTPSSTASRPSVREKCRSAHVWIGRTRARHACSWSCTTPEPVRRRTCWLVAACRASVCVMSSADWPVSTARRRH